VWPRSPAGFTIIEVLVAMLLLELAAVAALGAALTAHRLEQRTRRGAATDLARQSAMRLLQHSSACRLATQPTLLTLTLPATAERPALMASVRCGP
jgi:Tfp pilus assembly protein PilV